MKKKISQSVKNIGNFIRKRVINFRFDEYEKEALINDDVRRKAFFRSPSGEGIVLKMFPPFSGKI